MAFSTASFLAGVGSVVVVLSTGFAGGYFFASPDHNVPPNRLQREASNTTTAKGTDAKAASLTTPQAKPEVAAALATPAEAKPAQSPTTPSPAAAQSSASGPAPAIQQASTEQSAPPSTPAAPEQAASTSDKAKADRPSAERENTNKERAHVADVKAASRKRAGARKFAEQQRRQHELEAAAGAVRHIIHDRDGIRGRDGEEIIVRNGYMPDREAMPDREMMPDRDVMEVDQSEPPGPDVRPFNFFGR